MQKTWWNDSANIKLSDLSSFYPSLSTLLHLRSLSLVLWEVQPSLSRIYVYQWDTILLVTLQNVVFLRFCYEASPLPHFFLPSFPIELVVEHLMSMGHVSLLTPIEVLLQRKDGALRMIKLASLHPAYLPSDHPFLITNLQTLR